MESFLGMVDGVFREAYTRGRFGDLGPAFSAVLGSWAGPLAAAMREVDPTAHSRDAARAMADLARLTGECAGRAMQSIAGLQASTAGTEAVPDYDELAGRIDDGFRAFSSSPDFDRARSMAAAAVLDWLERDPDAASGLARALEPPPPFVPEPFGVPELSGVSKPCGVPELFGASKPSGVSKPSDVPKPCGVPEPSGVSEPCGVPKPFGVPPPEAGELVLRDGNVTFTAFPGAGETRACVLVIPGFTTGPHMFDLGPQRSVVRTLGEHGVDAWLLDWGRADETDRHRTVADQLERIDRAVDAMREAAHGRRPALAGHFHGGLLALLYCLRYPGKAGALVTLSTPVRFDSGEDAFAGWLRACGGERLVDVLGNIPGPLVAALAAAPSPMRWCGGGFFTLLDGLDFADAAARVARFEEARRFPPAFPGEMFRGLYRAFYRDDSFAAGAAAVIDGHRYTLSGLDTPLLNVFAHDDRVVPPAASRPLAHWAGASSAASREHPGGHWDLLAGHRTHAELLPGIAAWLVECARRP